MERVFEPQVTIERMLAISLLVFCHSHLATADPADVGRQDSHNVKSLVQQSGHKSQQVRDVAYNDLARIATTKDLPFLYDALATSRSGRTRTRVVRVIGHLKQSESIEALTATLKNDTSLWVRRAAAYALAEIGDSACEPALVEALNNDADTSVRKRAAASLMHIGGQRANLAVREALKKEQDHDVKTSHEWVLSHWRKQELTKPARLMRGKSSLGYVNGTEYLVYAPSTYSPRKQYELLVSVHGTDGRAEPYLEMCIQDAERLGIVVIAPRFDYPTFPNFGFLNVGFHETRADLRLLEILDQTLKDSNVRYDRFFLFGHSQGGQFVQRFVLAHSDRIIRAAACASGNYVHPDAELMTPDGFQPNPFAPDLDDPDFARFIKTPLAIVLGTEELQRRTDEADRFMKEIAAFAKENKIESRVQRFDVQGGRHRGTDNFPTAIKFLFDRVDDAQK